MTTTLLIVCFVASVCYGAVTPIRGYGCGSGLPQYSATNECVQCICKPGGSLTNCTPQPCTPPQFIENLPKRRKRQIDSATSESSVTSAKLDLLPGVESSTVSSTTQLPGEVDEAVLSVLNVSETAAVSPPNPALDTAATPAPDPQSSSASPPPEGSSQPPHPSTTQATAVKPRQCKSGSTWEEECNTCWCLDNGMAACTVKRCEAVTPITPITQTTTAAMPAALLSLDVPATTPTPAQTSPTPTTQTSPSPTPSTSTTPTSPTPTTQTSPTSPSSEPPVIAPGVVPTTPTTPTSPTDGILVGAS